MAFRERLIGIDEPGAWREALAGIPHGYWHTWEACRSAALASGLPTFLYACEDDVAGLRAACPFSERRWRQWTDIFTPTGFSGFCVSGGSGSLRERWRSFAVSRGYICAYFALHPRLAERSVHDSLLATNELHVIDLAVGEAELLARVDRSVRRDVRAWDASGPSLVTDRDLLTAFLLENYLPFMVGLNANPSAMWSDSGLRLMCADSALMMVGATDDEGVCAIYTFATTAWGAECHLNISVRDGRQYTTPMIWWGVRQSIARRLPWMNCGGGVSRNDAIARAKQKFRPDILPLLGAREVYRPDVYRSCCAEVGVDPGMREGFFPNYRARRTP